MIVATGGEIHVRAVVPHGIMSVNDSTGCNISEVYNNLEVCNVSQCYLVDGDSPLIDTSTTDWAAQLVTIEKNNPLSGYITFPHVLLTFIFDTPISPSSIEIDFFNCPQWGISAEFISVYSANNTNLVPRISRPQDGMFHIQDPSCESLTTATVTFNSPPTSVTWYIVAGFNKDSPIQWFT